MLYPVIVDSEYSKSNGWEYISGFRDSGYTINHYKNIILHKQTSDGIINLESRTRCDTLEGTNISPRCTMRGETPTTLRSHW